ncbi:hypothetical protein ACFGVS_29730 [Mucilaginibacter sp. AW1-7]|uniref:hypothetical protein n=1 Tax=Mucilaginibacter sp. AW1-7 TaxID=3349874 RepID=UPI003F732767
MKAEILKFFGCYFIADRDADYYLMVDTHNDKKVRIIDSECYNIIELLNDIQGEVENL